MNRLYITYKETREGGDPIDYEDKWSGREDLHINARITRVSLSQPDSYHYETIDLIDDEFSAGDEVHLVTVRYSDGDTFGSSYGHLRIECAFRTSLEAITEVRIIEQDHKDDPRMEWDKKNPRKYSAAIWKGYFSRLEYVDVETFTVFN